MLITSEQAKHRLGSTGNLVTKYGNVNKTFAAPQSGVEPLPIAATANVIMMERVGRPAGMGNLSPDIKTEIAIRERLGESQASLAKEFNVTQPAISQNKSSTSVDKKAVEDAILDVKDRAIRKLMESMDLMTPDKMDKCNAKDLSTIAASMSKVIQNTTPRQEQQNSNVQIMIYSPELRQERNFSIVKVS